MYFSEILTWLLLSGQLAFASSEVRGNAIDYSSSYASPLDLQDFDLFTNQEDIGKIHIVLRNFEFSGSLLIRISDESNRYFYIGTSKFAGGDETIHCEGLDTSMTYFIEISDGHSNYRKPFAW